MAKRIVIRRILLLPSFLCLDAPLVAAGWALLLYESHGSAGEVELWPLFSAVWVIYLTDRIYDARQQPPSRDLPLRHRFAIGNGSLLALLLATALCLSAWSLLFPPALDLIRAAIPIGVGTACYFFLFRGLSRKNRLPSWLPWKESLIAICYASGVALASSGPSWFQLVPGETVSLAGLVLANCLLISRAESAHDRTADPEAFFAGESRNANLWIYSLLAGAAFLSFATLAGETILFPLATLVTALALLAVDRRVQNPQLVQAASDAAMLLPWVALGCLHLFREPLLST